MFVFKGYERRTDQGRETASRGSAVRRFTMHLGIRLRRILRCAAYWDEFFLYEKMGRRAIDHEGSTSEEGPHPQKNLWESKGGEIPDAS